MKPEQAWLAALSQLQFEMPKAAFDTWVSPALFASFEDGTFVISTPSAYARDWLESRLSSSVTRLLTGIMNQSVQVQFVFLAVEQAQELAEEYQEGVEAEAEAETMDDRLSIQAEYQSIYDEIVQPERVIVFRGYFLRYLPLLGHELAWIYIGFRQSAYEAGAARSPGKKFSAPAVKVAENCGMNLRTFRRWIAKPVTWKRLRWLVEQVDDKPHWVRGKDGSPHRTAAQYRISMSLPLTPFDEHSLRAWISAELELGRSPLDVLRKALATPVDELLPWPAEFQPLEEVEGDAHTVQDVVLDLCLATDEASRSVLQELADDLAHHIMPPKDLVYLTHYFVEHWLPRLGPGPGWFVTLLRDRCYINHRSGEIRDEVGFEYGYADVARLLGLKRAKTIWEWLRDETLIEFVRDAGKEEGGEWEYTPRRFKVCLGEPMTPADREKANRMLADRGIGANDTIRASTSEQEIGATDTIRMDGQEKGHMRTGVTLENADLPGAIDTIRDFAGSDPIGASDTISNDHIDAPQAPIGATDTIREPKNGDQGGAIGASDTIRTGANRLEIGATGMMGGASGASAGANGSLDWREWHSLNSLTLKKHLRSIDNTTTPNAVVSSEEGVEPVVGDRWNLSDLLAMNQVSEKCRRELIAKDATAEAFVSWLIYAASSRGKGLGDPVGHTVSRLQAHPNQGAGGAFDQLGVLPPDELCLLIEQELTLYRPGNRNWREVMDGSSHSALELLARQLGVPLPERIY